MSHEVETMMYAGETPWHKLGKKVPALATSKEALVASGLDWITEPVPVFVSGPNATMNIVPDYKAVRRVTDGKVLGMVGVDYTPIQNYQSFEFFDAIVGGGQAIYETAGSIYGGKRVWILANLKGSVSVFNKDDEEIKKYVLLCNSHDGSLAFQVFMTPIRVVCNNTLTMALYGDTKDRFYARHTAGLMLRVKDAQEILGFANRFYDDYKDHAEYLARIALPEAEMPKLLAASFGLKPVEDVAFSTYAQNRMRECEEVIRTGVGQHTSTKGSLWWAYDGIVEYVDHKRTYRGSSEDKQVRGAMFGSGNMIKRRAWDYVNEYAKTA